MVRIAEVDGPFVAALHNVAVDDPLAAVEAVAKLRAVLDDAEALAVSVARVNGYTWTEIAQAVGRPMPTVHRHFQHLDVRRRRRTAGTIGGSDVAGVGQ